MVVELLHMEIKIIDNYSALLKGKKESVLINPSEDYLKKDKGKSRILIFTGDEFNGIGFLNNGVLIKGAGEYEIGGVEVVGVDIKNNQTIYTIYIDGVLVLVLGKLKEELSEKEINSINGVDVLLTPINFGENLSYKLVKNWSTKWGVNYLIPMGEDKEMLKKFLDASDEEGLEGMESLKVEKEELPEGLELKLLKIV